MYSKWFALNNIFCTPKLFERNYCEWFVFLQINHVNTKLSSPTEEPLSVVTPQKPKAVSQENGLVICAEDVHIIETSLQPRASHGDSGLQSSQPPPPPARIDDWWSAIYMDSEMLIVDPLHVDCWSDRVDVNPPPPLPLSQIDKMWIWSGLTQMLIVDHPTPHHQDVNPPQIDTKTLLTFW